MMHLIREGVEHDVKKGTANKSGKAQKSQMEDDLAFFKNANEVIGKDSKKAADLIQKSKKKLEEGGNE